VERLKEPDKGGYTVGRNVKIKTIRKFMDNPRGYLYPSNSLSTTRVAITKQYSYNISIIKQLNKLSINK